LNIYTQELNDAQVPGFIKFSILQKELANANKIRKYEKPKKKHPTHNHHTAISTMSYQISYKNKKSTVLPKHDFVYYHPQRNGEYSVVNKSNKPRMWLHCLFLYGAQKLLHNLREVQKTLK